MQEKALRSELLTTEYAALQGLFWFCYCGLFSFAAVTLLGRGYSASQTGVLLALATLSSCLLQPNIAAIADRGGRLSLKGMMVILFLSVWACLGALLFLPLSPLAYAAIYLLGALLLDLCTPLVNALCVFYNQRGVSVNFGVGRGVGSLFFAGASALFGVVAERFGVTTLLALIFLGLVTVTLAVLLFPRTATIPAPVIESLDQTQKQSAPCTLPQFFRRYRIYCISLVGVLFISAFHSMTENYLITILQRVGGNSANLGIALAIATVLEIPVIVLYSRFSRLTSSGRWLCIAAASFFVKSILFLLARSVAAIYLIETLQIISYSLYAPTAVYYARESVDKSDMVKGQAMITAAYALGASLGSFAGGRLLDLVGVSALLQCGVAFAFAALSILLITNRIHERNTKT